MVDACEYFPDLDQSRLRRGLAQLSSGNIKSAVGTLKVTKAEINYREHTRRNSYIFKMAQLLKGNNKIDSDACVKAVCLALCRYQSGLWIKHREPRIKTNPNAANTVDYYAYECFKIKNVANKESSVRGIIKENQ